jgi:hypothetical protein
MEATIDDEEEDAVDVKETARAAGATAAEEKIAKKRPSGSTKIIFCGVELVH